jgi:hypothetical protein
LGGEEARRLGAARRFAGMDLGGWDGIERVLSGLCEKFHKFILPGSGGPIIGSAALPLL